MQLVGSILGAVKPTQFNIHVTDPSIERGSYVKIKHDVYGWVLARVYSMKRFLDDFEEEVTTAEARTIGYVKGRDVLVPRMPFKPEEKVYLADKTLVTRILGLQTGREGNLYLGFLEGHQVPVYLNVKKTIGKHVSVLAKTGAGKSYTVAVLVEELLKNGVPIVIVDPHGEYASLAVENDEYDDMIKYGVKSVSYADRITEYATNTNVNPQAKKLRLRATFDMMELTDIMPMRLGERQKSTLYSALRDLEGGEYTLKDLIRRVEEEPTNVKWKVISGLETLEESGIFDGEYIPVEELVKPGRASVINLVGSDPHIQQLVVARLTRELFDARHVEKIPEFFFLIEEAHNFCPERGFGDAISSNILRTVASEGRKFGFHLCVVSQRPARVDKNVLSQCNTQVILKVTNPNDLRAIGQSIEGFTQGMEAEIKQLSVGHALVVGDCVEQPITVDVRVRETKHGAKRVVGVGGEVSVVEVRSPRPRRVSGFKPVRRSFWRRVLGLFVKSEVED